MNPERTPIGEAALRRALALTAFDARAAQRRMEPLTRGLAPVRARSEPPREAHALAYFFAHDGLLHVPLTLRRRRLRAHGGQVSLPGGRPEPGEAPWQTALREAQEEIALDGGPAERLAVLAPVYIPVTHTAMHVHVALGDPPERMVANPAEVLRIGLATLDDLLDPRCRDTTTRTIGGREIEIPYFHLAGLEVWGATAMALSELAERVRAVS